MLAEVAVGLERIETQGFGREIGFAGQRGGGPETVEAPITEFDGRVEADAISIQGQDGVASDSPGSNQRKPKVCSLRSRAELPAEVASSSAVTRYKVGESGDQSLACG